MTSVNELNGAKRARTEGYEAGYHDGREVGYDAAMHHAKMEYRKLTLMQYVIAFILGLGIAMVAGDIKEACAAEAETSVIVTITAEVACNPENCPQAGDQIIILMPVDQESAKPEETWWSRMVKWWKALF